MTVDVELGGARVSVDSQSSVSSVSCSSLSSQDSVAGETVSRRNKKTVASFQSKASARNSMRIKENRSREEQFVSLRRADIALEQQRQKTKRIYVGTIILHCAVFIALLVVMLRVDLLIRDYGTTLAFQSDVSVLEGYSEATRMHAALVAHGGNDLIDSAKAYYPTFIKDGLNNTRNVLAKLNEATDSFPSEEQANLRNYHAMHQNLLDNFESEAFELDMNTDSATFTRVQEKVTSVDHHKLWLDMDVTTATWRTGVFDELDDFLVDGKSEARLFLSLALAVMGVILLVQLLLTLVYFRRYAQKVHLRHRVNQCIQDSSLESSRKEDQAEGRQLLKHHARKAQQAFNVVFVTYVCLIIAMYGVMVALFITGTPTNTQFEEFDKDVQFLNVSSRGPWVSNRRNTCPIIVAFGAGDSDTAPLDDTRRQSWEQLYDDTEPVVRPMQEIASNPDEIPVDLADAVEEALQSFIWLEERRVQVFVSANAGNFTDAQDIIFRNDAEFIKHRDVIFRYFATAFRYYNDLAGENQQKAEQRTYAGIIAITILFVVFLAGFAVTRFFSQRVEREDKRLKDSSVWTLDRILDEPECYDLFFDASKERLMENCCMFVQELDPFFGESPQKEDLLVEYAVDFFDRFVMEDSEWEINISGDLRARISQNFLITASSGGKRSGTHADQGTHKPMSPVEREAFREAYHVMKKLLYTNLHLNFIQSSKFQSYLQDRTARLDQEHDLLKKYSL